MISSIARRIGGIMLSVVIAWLIFEIGLRLLLERPEIHSLTVVGHDSRSFWERQFGNTRLHMWTAHGARLRANVLLAVTRGGSSYEILTDSDGCRRARLEPVDGIKVLFIGDSISAGIALPEEQTFIGRLKVRAINCGVDGLGTEDEVWRLREVLDKKNPDLVVLQFFLNDYQRSLDAGISYPPRVLAWSWAAQMLYPRLSVLSYNLFSKPVRYSPVQDALFEKWREQALRRVASQARSLAPTSAKELRWIVQEYFDDIGAAWSDGAWDLLSQKIKEFQNVCDQRGKRMAVVGFPIRFQVDHPDWDNFPQRKLAEILEKLQVPFLDLLPLMQKLPSTEKQGLYPAEDPVHPSALGHLLTAKWLSEFLSSLDGDHAKHQPPTLSSPGDTPRRKRQR